MLNRCRVTSSLQVFVALSLCAACSQRVSPADSGDALAVDASRSDARSEESSADVDAERPGFAIGTILVSQGTGAGGPYVLLNAWFAPPGQRDPNRREFDFAGCRWFEASGLVPPSYRVDDLRLVDRLGELPATFLGDMRPVYEGVDLRHRWQTYDMIEFVAPSIGLRFTDRAPSAAVIELPPPGLRIARGGTLPYRVSMADRADARMMISLSGNIRNDMGALVRRRAHCTVSGVVSEGAIPWTVLERLGAGDISVQAGAGEAYLVDLENHSLEIRLLRNPVGETYRIE